MHRLQAKADTSVTNRIYQWVITLPPCSKNKTIILRVDPMMVWGRLNLQRILAVMIKLVVLIKQ